MAHKSNQDESQSASKAYETRDVKLRPLLVFAAGLAVVFVMVSLVVLVLLRLFSGEAAREDAELAPTSLARPEAPNQERLPPQPRIQANPEADMAALRRQEDAILTTYGWVDRQAGIARIPIDVAMKQVLEEGLPVRQPDSAPPAAGTPAPAGTGSRPSSGGLAMPTGRAVTLPGKTPQGGTKKGVK